jgi:hypothetical protein
LQIFIRQKVSTTLKYIYSKEDCLPPRFHKLMTGSFWSPLVKKLFSQEFGPAHPKKSTRESKAKPGGSRKIVGPSSGTCHPNPGFS